MVAYDKEMRNVIIQISQKLEEVDIILNFDCEIIDPCMLSAEEEKNTSFELWLKKLF